MIPIQSPEKNNSHAPTGTLSWREKLAYGSGEVANNLSWTMVGGFLLYYYTNVALLPVAALGVLMFVSRGLDAFVDPLVGLLMDRTQTKFGRAKPYILFGCLPLGVFAVVTFTSPFTSMAAKLVFAYVTLFLLGVFYSVVSIPYGALMPMMTKDGKESVQLGSFRSVGTSVGSVAVTTLTLPLVHHFGPISEQRGFTAAATIFAVAGTAMYLLVYRFTKERYVDHFKLKPLTIRESLREVSQNEIFRVTAVFTLVHLVRIGVILGLTVYFALMVLKAPWAIPLLFAAMSVGSMISASMASRYFLKFGFRRGNLYALIFAIACYGAMIFALQRPLVFVLLFALSCIGSQACTSAIFAMVSNAADYHEIKFFSRNDGLIFSFLSLALKAGIAMGASLVAFGLQVFHYDPSAITPRAIDGIRLMFFGLPGILMVIQICVILFYRQDLRATNMLAGFVGPTPDLAGKG